MPLFKKIFGDENSRFLKRAFKLVEEINAQEKDIEKLSLEELKAKTAEFKERLKNGETLDNILPEAFACVREAAKRTLSQRHYDVQLVGGIALHEGKVAEMKTGEGKTLASTLPVYLNALKGKGVHVVTVNDYLSRRDAVWMGQIYSALGMSVGCINHDSAYLYEETLTQKDEDADETRDDFGSFKVVHEYFRPVVRKEAYSADITYGTNNEFGFDYLRDNLVSSSDNLAQRTEEEGGWNFVIVDEVDSILIDEARTPLIISRPDEESGKLYQRFAGLIPQLKEGEDYSVDEKMRAASLTEKGISKIEGMLGMKNIYDEGSISIVHHLEQALKAQALFSRDKDYVVKDGEVIIVDTFTGRLMPGRRYSEGLHQAIEAKEGVPVQRESRTVATITFQNYFRLYKKLSGMTGTAFTSSEELFKVYGLEVIVVPTNKPLVRKDGPDNIYGTEKGKFKAVAREIKKIHETGQPMLVGTSSIEKNEYVGALLKQLGIPYNILNAKNHEREAEIIAQAGHLGAVTVATNMAGRGVDIVLGGNPQDADEAEKVRQLGGLYVLGTERHEARRIDNQLRGRAGRQGDSGSSQFFVSLEDDLMRIFGGDKVKDMMGRLNIPEDEPIRSSIVSKAIESAQSRIEGYHFDARKHVLDYDEVINKHRETIYTMRREVIQSKGEEGIREEVLNILHNEAQEIISRNTDPQLIAEGIKRILPMSDDDFKDLKERIKKLEDVGEFTKTLQDLVESSYHKREEQLGKEALRSLEKIVMLRVIDELWMDHLEQMDYIKTSVGLRAYGQRDPLVEYRNEAHRFFQELLSAIQTQVAGLILRVDVLHTHQPSPNLQFSGPVKRAEGVMSRPQGRKIGRNEVITITNGSETKKLKYKKALPFIESGKWKLI